MSVVGGTHGCISPDVNGTRDCLTVSTSASDACACLAASYVHVEGLKSFMMCSMLLPSCVFISKFV